MRTNVMRTGIICLDYVSFKLSVLHIVNNTVSLVLVLVKEKKLEYRRCTDVFFCFSARPGLASITRRDHVATAVLSHSVESVLNILN